MTVVELKQRDWKRGLAVTDKGAPRRNVANVLHVLSQHPEWQGVLGYDQFAERVVKLKAPPVREQDAATDQGPGAWTEADSVRTAAWFTSAVGFDPAVMLIDTAIVAAAERNIVHPVRDWLSSLAWDGTPRLDVMLAAYLGADASAYTAAVGARWMISAVARAMRPGCKADCMLVLEGDQGIGKSTALRLLAGDPWFADTGIVLGDKDSFQALRGVWIYELAELSSMRGRDVERVKAFVSSTSDRYRPSYGRVARDFPRQTVFAGSTNETTYLSDPTGARRFWPVTCGRIELAQIERDRGMLWAEAVHRYRAGESWHLDTRDLVASATEAQADRAERDDWVEIVATWLAGPSVPAGDEREPIDPSDGFTTAQVLLGALDFSPDRITPAATKRVGHVLRALGYEPRRLRCSGTRERRYFVSQVDAQQTLPGTEPGTGAAGTKTAVVQVSQVSQVQAYVHEKDAHRGNRDPRGPGGPPGTWDSAEDVERDAIQQEGEV